MNDEDGISTGVSLPREDTGPDAVPVQRRTRRRSASRPAGPPAAESPAAESPVGAAEVTPTAPQEASQTAAGEAAVSGAVERPEGEPVAAAPRKTARKRTNRAKDKVVVDAAGDGAGTAAEVAAAEPAPASVEVQAPAAQGAEDAAAPEAEQSAPTRRRRVREPRPAVSRRRAPVDLTPPQEVLEELAGAVEPGGSVATQSVATQAEPTQPEPTQVEPAPARTTTRRTRSKRVVAEVEVASVDPEALEEDAEEALDTAEATAGAVSAPPFVPAEQVPATTQRAVAAPLAATMVFFQAPDPVAPRRRRAATRPAGPPMPGVESETAADGADRPEPADAVEDENEELLEGEGGDAGLDEAGEDGTGTGARRRRRRGGRGRRRVRGDGAEAEGGDADAEGSAVADPRQDAAADDQTADDEADGEEVAGETGSGSSRRRRRRRRRGPSGEVELAPDDPPNTVVKVREPRRGGGDDVTSVRGSTRLEAKRQRRREGREAGRRRPVITEAEFLARRESVDRVMVVREREGRTQIGVLEDGVLVEHYVARQSQASLVGNVYLGKVQNVLPSMEAAFVDIGKGRNAVLYAGEVNWDAAGLDGQPRRIEHALKAGEAVLVQVTKDPIGHKGARLTSQVSLAGRFLVYVPNGSMTGISRKLPDVERSRLKKILRQVIPDEAGVIVRTAAEGASEEELQQDVSRLQAQWEDISRKAGAVNAPALLYGEPDLAIRVVRDIFNEDFGKLVIAGDEAWETLGSYIGHVAPDLVDRLERWEKDADVFATQRIDEQLAKALDRKVWLPSGGSLVIDRTEAMTVIDVNTGKFTGAGGNLEETVTKNNIEAAEEIVRQLRLRDIGGIIVVDFIDMVLESNRDLVLRRLLECLGRDRTKHQVAEVTSLGLVQMTRKRVGSGLLEAFSETCEACSGRGVLIHDEPVEKRAPVAETPRQRPRRGKSGGDGD